MEEQASKGARKMEREMQSALTPHRLQPGQQCQSNCCTISMDHQGSPGSLSFTQVFVIQNSSRLLGLFFCTHEGQKEQSEGSLWSKKGFDGTEIFTLTSHCRDLLGKLGQSCLLKSSD